MLAPSRLVSFAVVLAGVVAAVDPAAIYDGGFGNNTNSSILLNIGNGGAGQSGLVKGTFQLQYGNIRSLLVAVYLIVSDTPALADAFIQDRVANGSKPFKVAWYQSDTTYSIRYLQSGTIDVGITYSPAAEQVAIEQGIATAPSYYSFRDHFLIVGPPSNPANLSSSSSILTMFSDLHKAAEAATAPLPVRFLSRYDKSATNIKESVLWLSIGQVRILEYRIIARLTNPSFPLQVPWATAYSTWYHQYIAFPIQALTAAILLNEYTLTDRGTFLSLPSDLTNRTTVYKASTDDESDPLLNPAHLLVGARAQNPDVAKAFAQWLVGSRGQGFIIGFKKNGQQLYTPAP